MADKRFEIINRPQQDSAEVWIYEDIGEGMFGGISAARFVQELAPVRNARHLNVYINSAGGNVFDGIAIHNSLKRLPGHKTVHVDGLAASIASVIAMAGDQVIMADNALMMIHDPWTMTGGYASDLRSMADDLDRVRDVIAGTYAQRSPLPVEQFKTLMAAETWFDARSAIAHGLADSTSVAKSMAAWVNWSWFKNHPPIPNETPSSVSAAPIPTPRLDSRRDRLNTMQAVMQNRRIRKNSTLLR
jgi:ATP-dependent protease ClpP protease subunit